MRRADGQDSGLALDQFGDLGLPVAVPAHEQWMCAGGALTNFLTALHVMGYGAKVVSGGKAADPAISAALCEPGEKLVGWIVIGTPTGPSRARGHDDPALIVRDWN